MIDYSDPFFDYLIPERDEVEEEGGDGYDEEQLWAARDLFNATKEK